MLQLRKHLQLPLLILDVGCFRRWMAFQTGEALQPTSVRSVV